MHCIRSIYPIKQLKQFIANINKITCNSGTCKHARSKHRGSLNPWFDSPFYSFVLCIKYVLCIAMCMPHIQMVVRRRLISMNFEVKHMICWALGIIKVNDLSGINYLLSGIQIEQLFPASSPPIPSLPPLPLLPSLRPALSPPLFLPSSPLPPFPIFLPSTHPPLRYSPLGILSPFAGKPSLRPFLSILTLTLFDFPALIIRPPSVAPPGS